MSEQESTVTQPFFQFRLGCESLTLAMRFWRLRDRVIAMSTGCWVWKGATNNRGYGRIRVGNKYLSTHRVVYELCVSPLPKNIRVCHHCDNPPCCRPSHLFAGTDFDNAMDCLKKGRNLEAILTEDDVREIRRLALILPRPKYERIAVQFGVSVATVKQTVYRMRWKYVE